MTTAVDEPLADVRAATVRITGVGTFVDPDFGAFEGAGSGSGFIIDDSGIAVTANHVVAGAGLLQVDVPGEDTPRNATVVATAECSDLALIDIEGDGFSTVTWAEGEPTPGGHVIAAGYPLGEEGMVLTSGVIGTAEANGEMPWSSVDAVIEHDASIQPGNSGGPLVDESGEVVGINFAGDTSNWTERFFAIGEEEARGILDSLERGRDVDSMGINGQIIESEDPPLAGLWVAGVTSGSPADHAGLEPGDIITSIEGVSVGTDGTMASYCDVLRTHDPSDALSMEVWRTSTSERYAGQFNGEELELAEDQTPPFVLAIEEVESDEESGEGEVVVYTDWYEVADDSGELHVLVPFEWSDLDGAPIEIGSDTMPALRAGEDLGGMADRSARGVLLAGGAVLGGRQQDADVLLDALADPTCGPPERSDIRIGEATGRISVSTGCGENATTWLTAALFADSGRHGIVVGLVALDDGGLAVLDRILRTYTVTEPWS